MRASVWSLIKLYSIILMKTHFPLSANPTAQEGSNPTSESGNGFIERFGLIESKIPNPKLKNISKGISKNVIFTCKPTD